MSCGVNIPLSSVVEAIVNDYADVFVGEILKRLNLNNSTINNGTFTDVTIRGGLTLDDTAKGALCSALQDCIATKIQDELGCERDNHVTDFTLTDKHLVITLKFGEVFRISKQELADFIGNITSNSGGITGGITGGTLTNSTTITVNNKDGSTATIDISGLDLGDKDTNTYPTHGEVVNNTTVRIHLNTGGYVDIDASTLASSNSPFIVSGVFVGRDSGYWLDFTRNDDTKVNVDMTDIINKIIQTVYDKVMRMGYRINTQAEDYTLVEDDFDGRTIVRADKDGDQTITIPKPTSEDFAGKAIIVRKTSGEAGTFVNLVAGSDVSLLPEDATPVRRVGSSVTLVYVGNGVYDVFGELP